MPSLDRYLAGEHEAVWRELREFGERVRDPERFDDAWAVACETMLRVRDNIEQLHKRLIQVGYQFHAPETAYVPPASDILDRLAKFEQRYGVLPLSLRAFYVIVGAVNFMQSRKQLVHYYEPRRAAAGELELLGEEDPLYIAPPEELFGDAENGDYDPEYGPMFFLAPDEFHKADYSGGENYHLPLPAPTMDFVIEGMYGSEEYFVDHLRITLRQGGFRGRSVFPEDKTSMENAKKPPPDLDILGKLTEGFVEF